MDALSEHAEHSWSSGRGGREPVPPAGAAVRATVRQRRFQRARSLLPLGLFFLVSAAAYNQFRDLPALPESLRAFLGFSPTPRQIGWALLAYGLSATLLTLKRVTRTVPRPTGLGEVAYLSAFYGFYHFSGAGAQSFPAVFAVGLTILGLEAWHGWRFHTRRIRRARRSLKEDSSSDGDPLP